MYALSIYVVTLLCWLQYLLVSGSSEQITLRQLSLIYDESFIVKVQLHEVKCSWWWLGVEWDNVRKWSQFIYLPSGLKSDLKFPATVSACSWLAKSVCATTVCWGDVFKLCSSCIFIFTLMLHLPFYNFEKLEQNLFVKKTIGGFTQFWYKCDHQWHKLMIIILLTVTFNEKW